MPRPICTTCAIEMRCAKNESHVELLASGQPYQIWSGDRYECPSCSFSVVVGFGRFPVVEQFLPEYAALRESENPLVIQERGQPSSEVTG